MNGKDNCSKIFLSGNGVLLNVSNVECGIEDNDQSDSNMDIDSGPVDFDENAKTGLQVSTNMGAK